jgi:RNA polymerase sigma-70 factor (ECF subfamily)
MQDDPEARWQRLISLLAPIHEQAAATARRLCRSAADGDDLYQETVLRVFGKLHTLRDESHFRSWFYAVLLNHHRTRYRRSFWRRFLPWDEAFPEDGPAGDDGGVHADRDRQALRMTRALATLSAEQREAVVLFEVDEYSIAEIATMQGTSVPAVKSRLTRGRERLRLWYEHHAGPAPQVARDGVPARAKASRSARTADPITPLATASVTEREPIDD